MCKLLMWPGRMAFIFALGLCAYLACTVKSPAVEITWTEISCQDSALTVPDDLQKKESLICHKSAPFEGIHADNGFSCWYTLQNLRHRTSDNKHPVVYWVYSHAASSAAPGCAVFFNENDDAKTVLAAVMKNIKNTGPTKPDAIRLIDPDGEEILRALLATSK